MAPQKSSLPSAGRVLFLLCLGVLVLQPSLAAKAGASSTVASTGKPHKSHKPGKRRHHHSSHKSAATPASGRQGAAAAADAQDAEAASTAAAVSHHAYNPPTGVQLAELEQELDDINVMSKYDRKLERLLLVMPLTESFEPPVGQFGHGHLQTSDRVSMPASVVKEVQQRKLEYPWQFEIQRVHRRGPRDYVPVELPMPTRAELAHRRDMPQLSRVTCTILDARSPEQYIFIPDWMMKSLRLRPRDVVKLRYKNLPQSTGCVHLQAHSESAATSHAVLEEELRHYSSLTAGTTISFVFNPQGGDVGGAGARAAKAKGKKKGGRGAGARREVKINVVQCLDAGGRPVESVCVQDADIGTEWLLSLDKVKKRAGARAEAAEASAGVKGRRLGRKTTGASAGGDAAAEGQGAAAA